MWCVCNQNWTGMIWHESWTEKLVMRQSKYLPAQAATDTMKQLQLGNPYWGTTWFQALNHPSLVRLGATSEGIGKPTWLWNPHGFTMKDNWKRERKSELIMASN